jgi:hypothetical protein
MSLLTYKEARPWARAIKSKVVSREMPPWGADPRFGHFRNSRMLTQEQIDTIVAWVDRGAPEGTEAAPEPPPVGEGGWSHPSGRPPDLVVEMPFEMEIPAQGELPWFDLFQPWPFKEDKFVEALQVLPGNAQVVHHFTAATRMLKPGTGIGTGEAWPGGPILSNVLVDGNGRSLQGREAQADPSTRALNNSGTNAYLLIYLPPLGFQQFRPGVGKRIPKDSILRWGLHYTPTGSPERDRTRLGLWFQKVPMVAEAHTGSDGEVKIVQRQELLKDEKMPPIPAYEGNFAVSDLVTFQDDVTLYSLWPHMHVRGKDMTYVVTYPDGREEVLLHVPRFDFNWQLSYEFQEPLKLPAGSLLRILGHFDNSAKNRNNPAPDKEVLWSQQSWDEMFTGYHEVSFDKDDRRPPTTTASNQTPNR